MTTRDLETVRQGFELVLKGLGIEPSEHTEGTALRAAKAWYNELCAGLTGDAPKITTFPGKSKDMIILRDIRIQSVCAHHLLPFTGTATIAYVPGGDRILGLSKLSRVAEHFARRPQVQEDLTTQIADEMERLVMTGGNGGVGVVMRCNHTCMELRGVRHKGDMLTSALRGVFNKPEARAEFLKLAGY